MTISHITFVSKMIWSQRTRISCSALAISDERHESADLYPSALAVDPPGLATPWLDPPGVDLPGAETAGKRLELSGGDVVWRKSLMRKREGRKHTARFPDVIYTHAQYLHFLFLFKELWRFWLNVRRYTNYRKTVSDQRGQRNNWCWFRQRIGSLMCKKGITLT